MSYADDNFNEKNCRELAGTWKSGPTDLSVRGPNLREVELMQARKRAKLSVLDLTDKDKKFLKELRIAL